MLSPLSIQVEKNHQKKSFQYTFYQPENESSVNVDEHTKNYTEISKYLASSHAEDIKDLKQLHAFPATKNLYKKFNVIMPAEADIERLFSIGGLISFEFYFYVWISWLSERFAQQFIDLFISLNYSRNQFELVFVCITYH